MTSRRAATAAEAAAMVQRDWVEITGGVIDRREAALRLEIAVLRGEVASLRSQMAGLPCSSCKTSAIPKRERTPQIVSDTVLHRAMHMLLVERVDWDTVVDVIGCDAGVLQGELVRYRERQERAARQNTIGNISSLRAGSS